LVVSRALARTLEPILSVARAQHQHSARQLRLRVVQQIRLVVLVLQRPLSVGLLRIHSGQAPRPRPWRIRSAPIQRQAVVSAWVVATLPQGRVDVNRRKSLNARQGVTDA
jgi:hypothetical protein